MKTKYGVFNVTKSKWLLDEDGTDVVASTKKSLESTLTLVNDLKMLNPKNRNFQYEIRKYVK